MKIPPLLPPSLFESVAQLPLHRVVPALRSQLDRLTLEEVARLVRPAATSTAPAAPSSLATAAAVVVGLPTPGSKLAEIERAVIRHALEEVHGNISAAARLLSVDRKALERKIARHRLR